MGLDYDMTAKQVLIAHCDEHHRRVKTYLRSFAEVSKAHLEDHSKPLLDHDHERAGMITGRDVVMRES